MSITIGEISYTNIIPAFYCVDRKKLKAQGCQFQPQVPSQLNKGMKNGDIDVAGISSFAFGQSVGEYELLPHLSVSSYGKVGSIFLFCNKRIEDMEGTNIALTSSSATSVHLLKLILKEFYGYKEITYQTMSPDPVEMKKGNDGFLLIGDDAIQASWNTTENWYCYDLGELWYQNTGLPMTYAVFAVRKEAAKHQPDIVNKLYKEMLSSKSLSLDSYFDDMVNDVQISHKGTTTFWKNYFRGLHYDFQDNEKKGLLYYYELNYKHGYLKHPVTEIEVWSSGNEVQYLS
ncbi:chorismate dehydratase [Salibacterium salarium]|uniref:menaquinone biosynthesis protein n=1 Tax=Salibacterium salarium TaxID=284579 RepID=UPI00277E954F|nr:menaquinone biosynthesis protein [Salibacterium salarium]MDQ0299442.1 chorismate dehydratase [Salibacterium salarium]